LNIVITGSSGFIAKNLIATLQSIDQHQLFFITRQTSNEELKSALQQADFLFHLAGVNRPNDKNEFYQGNQDFTKHLVELLTECNKSIPIVFSSSTQVQLNNDYGKSKKAAEEILEQYAKSNHSRLAIYRLPGVFGKWSQPHYNTVVATFCHQIANQEPIQVSDPSKIIDLVYIDDVIHQFLDELNADNKEISYPEIVSVYSVSLGELAQEIQSFHSSKESHLIRNTESDFIKKLFATYTSFLPSVRLKTKIHGHRTPNSSFAELLKSNSFGQISLNSIEAGAVRGNHWHHTKHEKFLVIQGEGIIRLRLLFSKDVMEFNVSGKHLEWIEIPPGYVHNIENTGSDSLITIMWANEIYNPERPDTYPEVV
jgi:UDP-2-acetamido-2,6-beta-L-arabino-hexul-4-ose reductase